MVTKLEKAKAKKANRINRNGLPLAKPGELPHQITKQEWNKLPKEKKKTRKNGERYMFLEDPGNWVRVCWLR